MSLLRYSLASGMLGATAGAAAIPLGHREVLPKSPKTAPLAGSIKRPKIQSAAVRSPPPEYSQQSNIY